MTHCDKCGEEVGQLLCGNCREEMEEKYEDVETDLVPLLCYDKETECYRFGCTCRECPSNKPVDELDKFGVGVYMSAHSFIPKPLLHEFDGDNIINQVCG